MNKKLFILPSLLLFFSLSVQAQLSVGYHQSNLSLLSVGYEINDRLMPELRLGTNLDWEDDVVVEADLLYQFIDRQEYELYAGLGFSAYSDEEGFVVPIGLNLFPFAAKRFGFHIEAAPLVLIESSTIFRGSWGIRYRFAKE